MALWRWTLVEIGCFLSLYNPEQSPTSILTSIERIPEYNVQEELGEPACEWKSYFISIVELFDMFLETLQLRAYASFPNPYFFF